jgi:hypothetical protein
MSPVFFFLEPSGDEERATLTAAPSFDGIARAITKRETDLGAEAMWQFIPYQDEWGALVDLRHGKPLIAVPREKIRHGDKLTEAGLWKIQPEGNAVRLISKVDPGRGVARDGIDHDVALFPIRSRTTLWLARDVRLDGDSDLPPLNGPVTDEAFYNVEVMPWDGRVFAKRLMLTLEDEWGANARVRLRRDPRSPAAQFRLMPAMPRIFADGKALVAVDRDSRLAVDPSLGPNVELVNLGGSRQFHSGDSVALRTARRRYVSWKSDGTLELRAWTTRANETFTIRKLTGAGEILPGQPFTLRAGNGKYLSHDRGRNTVAADKDHADAWETFTLGASGAQFHLAARNRGVPLVSEGTGEACGLFQRALRLGERDYNRILTFFFHVPPGAPRGTFNLRTVDGYSVAPGGKAGAEEGEVMELRSGEGAGATLLRLRPAPPVPWPDTPDLTMEKYRDPVEDISRTLAGGAIQVIGTVSGIPGGSAVFGAAFNVIWPANKVSLHDLFNSFRADILREVKTLIAQHATFQAKGALESAHEQYLISYANARRANMGGGPGLETVRTYAVNAGAAFLNALNFLSLERDERGRIRDTEQNVASAKAGLPLYALCVSEYINVLQETALLHAFKPALVLPDVRLRTRDQYVVASPADGVRYSATSDPLGRALRVLSRAGHRTLKHGDRVVLRSPAGTNVTAIDGGGKGLVATTPTRHIAGWEEFTIERVGNPPAKPGDDIGSGDSVALRTQSGHYLSAPDGGGPLNGAAAHRAAWETFTIEIIPPPAPLGDEVPPKTTAQRPFDPHIENLRTFATRRYNDTREIFLFLVRERQSGKHIFVNQQHSTFVEDDDRYDLWSQSFRDAVYNLDVDLVERKVAKPAGWDDFENHPPLQIGMDMYRQHLATYAYYFKYRYFDAIRKLPAIADETLEFCEAMWTDALLATEYSYAARTAPRFDPAET